MVGEEDYEKKTRNNEKLGINYIIVCGTVWMNLSLLMAGPGIQWRETRDAKFSTSVLVVLLPTTEPDNIKMEGWLLSAGRWVGIEYIKRKGKAIQTLSGYKPAWMRRDSMQHTTAEK